MKDDLYIFLFLIILLLVVNPIEYFEDTNPDEWDIANGEVLLPYDPKDWDRLRYWPKRERRRREAKARCKKEEAERKRREKEDWKRRHADDPDTWGPSLKPRIL